ncbi:MAG: sigma 54-interacting transcriptional regulator [Phycisphaerae bacterium]|jgi:transcriptional regulator with GAF, ATPase, and Fis domain
MQRIRSLLLDVWREACRHIEITASTENIARMVARECPVAALLVRRADLQSLRLETIAIGAVRDAPVGPFEPTPCTSSQMDRLVAWSSRPGLIRCGGRSEPERELAIVFPRELKGDCLAGPLPGAEGQLGVLLAVAAPGEVLTEQHARLIEALLEPFSAAFENDRRLHELASLREAAEAERRSLLARFGRRDAGEKIVGAEAGLQPVMQRVDIVGKSDVPVLLLGETGTGKEVIARAIHLRSPRHDKPFIRVNCGAIPSELIDSQLFGHERGSFTGAVDTHKGWFERADSGTLFLDEIGELPPAAQVRLLRVLQDGFIERVGGRQSIHVDVRVVAATHRDLAAMVQEGRFREDLWYRLAVFPIPLPPLRERTADIPALACHFAEKAATRFGLPLVMPTPEDMHQLMAYPWPGNVRELAAVIDRAALLGNGGQLDITTAIGGVFARGPCAAPASAPPAAHSRPEVPPPAPAPVGQLAHDESGGAARAWRDAGGPETTSDISEAPPATLNDVMRRHIEQVLRSVYGRIEGPFGAARKLGINPHTLRSRMRKLGIDWRRFRTAAK